jgi:hypothetical protein
VRVWERAARLRASGGYDSWQRRTSSPLLVLSLAFVVVLLLPIAVRLPGWAQALCTALDVAIWAAFVVDYIALLYLAPSRGRYLRTHLLDLAIIVVPFLRPLRAARLLRLIRLLLLAGMANRRARASLRGWAVVGRADGRAKFPETPMWPLPGTVRSTRLARTGPSAIPLAPYSTSSESS